MTADDSPGLDASPDREWAGLLIAEEDEAVVVSGNAETTLAGACLGDVDTSLSEADEARTEAVPVERFVWDVLIGTKEVLGGGEKATSRFGA